MVKPKPMNFRRYITEPLALCPLVANGRKPHGPGFPAGIRLAAKAPGEAALAAFRRNSAQQLRKISRPTIPCVNPEGRLSYTC